MWTRSLSLLLLLLLLSAPLSLADIILTDQEFEELENTFTELETLLNEQERELIKASIAIEELKKSLSEAELSLKKQEKENRKKIVKGILISLLIGGATGYLIGIK